MQGNRKITFSNYWWVALLFSVLGLVLKIHGDIGLPFFEFMGKWWWFYAAMLALFGIRLYLILRD